MESKKFTTKAQSNLQVAAKKEGEIDSEGEVEPSVRSEKGRRKPRTNLRLVVFFYPSYKKRQYHNWGRRPGRVI
jgi:hypothetical protein